MGAFALAVRITGGLRNACKGFLKAPNQSPKFFRIPQKYAYLVKTDSPFFWGILAFTLACIAAKSHGALEASARADAPALILLQTAWVAPLLEGHQCKAQKEGWGTPLRETLPARTQLFVERGRVLFRPNPLDTSWSVWRCPGLKSPSPDSLGEPLASGLPGLQKLTTLLPGPLISRERKSPKSADPREIRY